MSDKQQSTKTRLPELDDLYRIRLLAEPQISPDGKTVVYVQTRLRKKKNDYASNIWVARLDGSEEPRRYTGGAKRDMSPRFSPDGSQLAFLSTRSGKAQIWVMPTNGGEARQLTYCKRGAGEMVWSPDGKWIVFSSDVDNELDKRWAEEARKNKDASENEADRGSGDSENRTPGSGGQADLVQPPVLRAEWDEDTEDDEEGEDKGDHAKVFTRVQYKFDGQGLIERRGHLFIVPSKGGTPRQVTDGDWDAWSPLWSPDGKTLAYLSAQGPDAEYKNAQDIYVMPVDAEGNPGESRRMTNNDAHIQSYSWLPSGEGFALFAHSRINEGAIATNPELWTLTLEGERRNLTEGFDRPIGNWVTSDLRSGVGELRPQFSRDGATIYFPVTSEGCTHVFSVPVQGGDPACVIGGPRQVLNFSVGPDAIVFAASTDTLPNDLFAAALDGSGERRLTEVNADLLGGLTVLEPEEFWIDRPDGGRVQGWLLRPPSAQKDEKVPLVVEVHGGPHMSYGRTFFLEFQATAARGMAVLYTNPRGSQGYGQKFSDAITNDWGGIDYDDIMACVDHAIAQGGIDEARLAIAGGSYGGFMSTWAIGHTDRFKAAVASRMVSNLISNWGSSDFTWQLLNWEFEGSPYERRDIYVERSPLTYAPNIKTPLLITHAEDDERTCIEQGEQMYRALTLLRREVKMVRFPSGGHDVSRSGKPSLRVERMEHIIDWLQQHLTAD